jgi:predicted metal-dependent hydrolase
VIEWLRSAGTDPEIEIGGKMLRIEFTRHKRAKRMTMRLAPDGSAVRITMPLWCSTREAVQFAEARQDWLCAQHAKIPASVDILDSRTAQFRGNSVKIDWQAEKPRRVHYDPGLGCVMLGGPRDTVKRRLQRWLEGEALENMRDDLRFYCERAGLAAPPIKLSRAQRRWGSCSAGGTVRINWRLIQAPDAVRRSVVAHETAHLVHFDHSPAFHALLGEIFESDIRAADRWLKDHGRELYTAFG